MRIWGAASRIPFEGLLSAAHEPGCMHSRRAACVRGRWILKAPLQMPMCSAHVTARPLDDLPTRGRAYPPALFWRANGFRGGQGNRRARSAIWPQIQKRDLRSIAATIHRSRARAGPAMAHPRTDHFSDGIRNFAKRITGIDSGLEPWARHRSDSRRRALRARPLRRSVPGSARGCVVSRSQPQPQATQPVGARSARKPGGRSPMSSGSTVPRRMRRS